MSVYVRYDIFNIICQQAHNINHIVLYILKALILFYKSPSSLGGRFYNFICNFLNVKT